jgi:hypothetical protein
LIFGYEIKIRLLLLQIKITFVMSHPVTSKKHLRIRTPNTKDGLTPIRDDESGEISYKTTLVPLSARKAFERENSKLPKFMKHIIEEMDGDREETRSQARRQTGKNKQPAAQTSNDSKDDNTGSQNTNQTNDTESDEDREDLLALSKTELQKKYATKFGEKPANARTKDELADAILNNEKFE